MCFFFNSLEECEEKLKKLKIKWPTSHKITQAVTEMTNSGIFNEEDIMDWEDKEEDEKMWIHCQSYWNKIFKKRKCFNNLKPKQHGFEGAANIDELPIKETTCDEIKQRLQEVANSALADKEHIQQMSTTTEELFIIIKKTAITNRYIS